MVLNGFHNNNVIILVASIIPGKNTSFYGVLYTNT